jgi:two-component system, NtrC family, response regulator HydG
MTTASHHTATPLKVLLVEDDADLADHVEALIRGWGYEARTSRDGRGVRHVLREWIPDLAVIDLGLPDVDGLDLLRELRAREVEAVVMSGRANLNVAVETVESGAMVFLEKPVSAATLRSVLADVERRTTSLRVASSDSRAPEQLADLVSESPRMHEVFDLIRCVAPTEANVLIVGENGTGKELVANAIHALSPRRDGPFIKVNCAAIPEELIESELFGHRRGAFTGAVMDHVGLFASAAGGTLLLDEIGEMPAHLQTKLLRVLQERQARPVGALRPVDLNFRLICATNTDLRAAATRGQFRQDLYYRINTIGIAVPPLRERPEDIPLLARHFVARYARRYGRRIVTLDPSAEDALLRHDWRGNVRELEHAIEHAVIVSRGPRIRVEHLPETLHPQPRRPLTTATGIPPMLPLAELERLAILRTLEHTRGNKRAAAAILGVYRPTLYSKLRKYGMS